MTGDEVLEDFIRKQIEIEAAHVQEIRDDLQMRSPLTLVEKPTQSS